MASYSAISGTFDSFVVDGVQAEDVTTSGIVLVSPFVRALMQCQRMQRWATPSVIPDIVIPKALDGEFSISVESFGSHLDNTGLLGDVARRATKILGGDNGYFSTSGTTASNHKVMLTISNIFKGQPLLAGRNIHHSITHSSNMYGVPLIFLNSAGYISEFEAFLPPTASEVAEALDANPNVKIVLITSPTYEGIIADVEGIAEAVHKRGALLWVDQAWGSHLGLAQCLPRSSVQLGADIMCTSNHKTGGALQGAAMLVFRKGSALINDEFENAIRDAHQEVETTSPNFEIIASIDASMCRLASDPTLLDRVVQRMQETKECLRNTLGDLITILDETHPKLMDSKFFLDPFRIQVALPHGAVGHQAASYLEHHGIIAEKAGLSTLLFIYTFQLPTNAAERLARILRRYLKKEAKLTVGNKEEVSDSGDVSPRSRELPPHSFPTDPAPQWLIDSSKRKPEPAFSYTPRIVSAHDAVGMVAHETVECYPPGIPVIIPGFVITQDHVDYLISMKAAGAHVVAADKTLETFRVRERKVET